MKTIMDNLNTIAKSVGGTLLFTIMCTLIILIATG